MRLPIIPIVIAAALLGAAFYLFNAATSAPPVLDVPELKRIADIDGTETEVALAPDGQRCAVIADGDLWLLQLSDGSRTRLTQTPEPESFPAWSPDGRITFTRGNDTFVHAAAGAPGNGELLKSNATDAGWSPSGRMAFVRERAMWITDVGGKNEREILVADSNPNITVLAPRFSSDSLQIAFIKRLLNLSGEVWTIDSNGGHPRALIADRGAEYPLDVGWILGGNDLVYLTNRSGAYSLWHVNFERNTLLPLTQPLVGKPLAAIGMSASGNRILLPRHFETSAIATSGGKTLVPAEKIAFQPSVSPDGKRVAYTVAGDNGPEVWTAGTDGSAPVFRAVGQEARFSADGLHLIYTHTDLMGNSDIWQLDTRNGNADRISDAEELDVTPDASSDGRWLAFASTRTVAPAIWIIPASGGKRLRINEGGYGPRFSPDARSILFWNLDALWTMAPDGRQTQKVMPAPGPLPSIGAWFKGAPVRSSGSQILSGSGEVLYKSDKPIWPGFDVMANGEFLVAPIDIRETSLWEVDLIYKTK